LFQLISLKILFDGTMVLPPNLSLPHYLKQLNHLYKFNVNIYLVNIKINE